MAPWPCNGASYTLLSTTLQVTEWETPASRYAERVVGNYRLHVKQQFPGLRRMYGVDGFICYDHKDPLPVMSLQELREGHWQDWMIDDPFNAIATQRYCEAYKGRVLTAGLGLGLAAHFLDENPKVTDVAVAEISPEVVALVGPYCKATVWNMDFWDAVGGGQWDGIFLDTWVTIGKEQHDSVMEREVRPAYKRLRALCPDALINIFGFAPYCDTDIQQPAFAGATKTWR